MKESQALREKEIEERKEQSVFEEESNHTTAMDTNNIPSAQLTRGEVHPSIARDENFPSLSKLQLEQIQKLLEHDLSIRDCKRCCEALYNFNPSYGVIQAIQKKIRSTD